MGQARDEQGNIWETDAQGNAIRLVSQAGSNQTYGGVDPSKAYAAEDQQMQRDTAARSAAQAEIANRNSAAANSLAERKFAYDQSRRNEAPLTAKDRADAIVEYNKAIQLRATIDDLVTKYRTGPGSTSGAFGIADYLPTPDNNDFNNAANKLRGSVKATQGFTGGEGNTASESRMNIGPFIPSSYDYDQTTKSNLDELYNQSDNAVQRTVALLGGVPDQYGNVTQQPASKAVRMPFEGQPQQQPQDQQNVAALMTQGGGNGGQGPQGPDQSSVFLGDAPKPDNGGFAPYGATSRTVNNPALAGLNETLGKMIAQGATREQLAEFAASKGVIFGDNTKFGQDTPAGRAWMKQNPGKPYPVNVDDMSVPMSGTEQFMNNAPQTRAGTFLTQAGNAGGFGIPQMLAGGDGFDYLRSQEPGYSFAGDVAGVIGGTAALGGAGRAIAGKVAPNLLGGAGKAAFGRGLATDATYGGIYGGTTEGDPLTGAATAALGSGLGMGIGKGIQKTFAGGGDLAAQALRERGIPLTMGQAMGGMSKRIEDGATSIPFIGDMINNRRTEGLRAFNKVAFQDGGAPIGAQVDDIGEAGMDALRPQISRYYDNTTQDVNVPLDQQYATDLAPNLQQGSQLVGDYGAGFSRLVNNRIKPALDSGQLSGENYQNMTRAMRDSRASVKGQPFAEDYIEPVRGIEDATRSLMTRQGGDSVIAGLARADEAYRNSKVLGNAVAAAKNTDGMFMPSQLNNASSQNAAKFGGNAATENRPFRDLAMNGQAVLPSKMADSGTPFRTGLGVGGISALTGGAGYVSNGDPMTTVAPLATTGLLALLGTKTGQKLLVKSLMDRSDWSKGIGKMIGSRKGQRAISGAGAGLLLAGE